MHLFLNLAHKFYRTQRTGHYTGPKRGKIKHIEHGMVQFGYEHGRNTVKCRTAFPVNRCEGHQRVETFDHHLGAPMSETVHGGQYHSKTMEQRYADTEFVLLREIHMFTRK
jgi:hypothetical protein